MLQRRTNWRLRRSFRAATLIVETRRSWDRPGWERRSSQLIVFSAWIANNLKQRRTYYCTVPAIKIYVAGSCGIFQTIECPRVHPNFSRRSARSPSGFRRLTSLVCRALERAERLVTQHLVDRIDGGWRITDKGRLVLDAMEIADGARSSVADGRTRSRPHQRCGPRSVK